MSENIQYYDTRLRFVRELFKNHEHDLLQENKDKIMALVVNYNRFKGHPDYDKLLAEFPETIIFN